MLKDLVWFLVYFCFSLIFVFNVNYDWLRLIFFFMFIGFGVFIVYGRKVVSVLLIFEIFKVIVVMRLYGDFFFVFELYGKLIDIYLI